jgi:carbamoyl-phosphate synthase large subunit
VDVTAVNVFVTGAGALVGQGVLRLLRMTKRRLRIVTGDPDARAAGHWLGDKAYVIPMACEPNYVPEVERIVRREKVDILFVGTDVELSLFAREKSRFAEFGVKVIVSSPRVVEVADDKWLTAHFLRDNDFPFPRTALASDPSACHSLAAECGLPLFSKPRRGARSVGVRKLETVAELESVLSPTSGMVIQEYLPDDSGEFTAGCIGAVDGMVGGVVVLKRDLRDGNTFRAYRDGAALYEARIAGIATRLGIEGPANFQFRVKNGEPVVFEINARFSGTTPLRAMFGYNEVEAIVENVLTGAPLPKPELREGAVLRVWSDIFVPTAQLEGFARAGTLDRPSSEAMPFLTSRGS